MATPPCLSVEAVAAMSDAVEAPKVLVVDDNPSIHDDFRKVLRPSDSLDDDLGRMEESLFGVSRKKATTCLDVVSVYQGGDALDLVRAGLETNVRYALAFIDVRMPPGIDGVETSQRLLEIDSEIQLVICTAYSDHRTSDFERIFGNTDRVLFLKKPFSAIEVRQLASSLHRKWLLRRQASLKFHELEGMVREKTRQLEIVNDELQKEMKERERVERELRHSQKLEAIGQLAAGVSHEVNNPLCYIIENLNFVSESIVGSSLPSALADEINDAVDDAKIGADRIKDIVASIGSFSRKHESLVAAVDVSQPVQRAIKMAGHELRHVAELVVDLTSVPSIEANAGQLEQVFLNFLINAAHACSASGREDNVICVSSYVDSGGWVVVEVGDSGCGVPSELLDRVFEPFFTTKSLGAGTGLGLSVCHGIVSSMGGEVFLDSVEGVGTNVRARFPQATVAQEQSRVSPTPKDKGVIASTTQSTVCILVVDDEPSVLRMMERALTKHSVFTARDGNEALEWCRKREFDLILCDLMMPRVDGQSFYEQLETHRPGQRNRVVFVSGGAFTSHARAFLARTPNRCLAKPFTRSQLCEVIDVTLEETVSNPEEQARVARE